MDSKPILSIIIVSYHAKHFLYLTLQCIYNYIEELHIEIIVVDNSISMDTIDFCASSFPKVQFIKNKENIGFGRANNLGVTKSLSDTILILNPDIIISKETILENSRLLNSSEDISAVGVRMINGLGEYLPESKRGFPNFSTSFYKIIGLNKIFKTSAKFNNYYLSTVSENSISEIDVLPGAAIFIKKYIYNEIGGFDSQFFMYGEDIDLSYQIHKNGKKIIYNGTSTLVHFKGESTQKLSWKYHDVFYEAMKLFWNKNYKKNSSIFTHSVVTISVTFLKLVSFLVQILKILFFPILDFGLIYFSLTLFTKLWEVNIKGEPNYYPEIFYTLILPFYALSWIFFLFLSKLYVGEINLNKLFKGSFFGTLFILIIYFIVPENYRYSRAIVLFGAISALILPFIVRLISFFVFKTNISIAHLNTLKAKIYPNTSNQLYIEAVFRKYSDYSFSLIQGTTSKSVDCILDVESMNSSEIIEQINHSSGNYKIWFYLHSKKSILLSQGKNSQGLVLSEDSNFSYFQLSNKILKNLFDSISSIFLLIFSPLFLIFGFKKFVFILKNCVLVFFKFKTWVMISNEKIKAIYKLPQGVFELEEDEEYLRNYSINQDIVYFISQLFKL